MDIAELSRRVENLIRIGTVAEVDHANARIRVTSGGLDTDWLPWFERRAGATRSWDPPTVGEQVMILSPSGEPGAGICLVGIYSAAAPAPSASASLHLMDFPDGAKISYDHASGALEATGIKTALVEASESITAQAGVLVTIDAPDTHVTGNLVVDQMATIKGLLTYQAGLAGSPGSVGSAINGNLTHINGALSSNGIVLHTHTHSGVTSGPSNTGGPQ